MRRIGERIKKKREQLNLHLNELAEKVGISPSALSQIEKAKSFPSILTLKSIAENLHTTVGELVGENETSGKTPVVLKKDIQFVYQTHSGTSIFLLSVHDSNKQMDTFLVQFNGLSGIDQYFKNGFGQIFCYIVHGEVRFELDNKNYILQAGDNIYFNAKSSFNAFNNHESVSEMIWIQSPPRY